MARFVEADLLAHLRDQCIEGMRLLAMYCHIHQPVLGPSANQLELLRAYRNRVKYEAMEASSAQTRVYYEAVRRIYDAIKDHPLRIVAGRQRQ